MGDVYVRTKICMNDQWCIYEKTLMMSSIYMMKYTCDDNKGNMYVKDFKKALCWDVQIVTLCVVWGGYDE